MMTTKRVVAMKIDDYLHHRIAQSELVAWAEDILMEGDIDERDAYAIRDALAKIGLGDSKAFGLSWEDCEELLASLGYKVDILVKAA